MVFHIVLQFFLNFINKQTNSDRSPERSHTVTVHELVVVIRHPSLEHDVGRSPELSRSSWGRSSHQSVEHDIDISQVQLARSYATRGKCMRQNVVC